MMLMWKRDMIAHRTSDIVRVSKDAAFVYNVVLFAGFASMTCMSSGKQMCSMLWPMTETSKVCFKCINCASVLFGSVRPNVKVTAGVFLYLCHWL